MKPTPLRERISWPPADANTPQAEEMFQLFVRCSSHFIFNKN